MGERGRLRQAIAETKQRDAELRLRMEDLRNRFVEEATSEAGKLENDIIQTRERIRPLRDAKNACRSRPLSAARWSTSRSTPAAVSSGRASP